MAAQDIADVLAMQSGATEAQLKEELVRPWARLRVAHDPGGAVLGFALIWHVTDELHLLDVVVHPTVRRRGIGRALMDDLLAYARASAALHVYLEVRRSNEAALRLYRAAGFSALGVRKKYYPDGEDAIEMVLALDPRTFAVLEGKDLVNLGSS